MRLTLGILAVLALSAPARCAQAPVGRIVVFSPTVKAAARPAVALQAGASMVHELPLVDAVAVELPAANLQAFEAALKAAKGVLRVEDDLRLNWLRADAEFTLPAPRSVIPRFVASAAAAKTELPWGVKRVNAPDAWKKSKGQGVKVAIIDTGIESTHKDLAPNVAGGWNALDENDEFQDDNGHGSHVAGIVAAAGSPDGILGVAPQASLYGVKVLDFTGSGRFSDIIAGIQWSVEHKMQVINMSLGASTGTLTLQEAVAAAAKAGLVVVAAAGNSKKPVGYPAAYPGALAIAALDQKDFVAPFSNYGPQIAFIAPGVNVKSCYWGGYENLSGTSMAAPHVSGLAALVISAKRLPGPSVSAALRSAAGKLWFVGRDKQGAGVVNGGKLLR